MTGQASNETQDIAKLVTQLSADLELTKRENQRLAYEAKEAGSSNTRWLVLIMLLALGAGTIVGWRMGDRQWDAGYKLGRSAGVKEANIEFDEDCTPRDKSKAP